MGREPLFAPLQDIAATPSSTHGGSAAENASATYTGEGTSADHHGKTSFRMGGQSGWPTCNTRDQRGRRRRMRPHTVAPADNPTATGNCSQGWGRTDILPEKKSSQVRETFLADSVSPATTRAVAQEVGRAPKRRETTPKRRENASHHPRRGAASFLPKDKWSISCLGTALCISAGEVF